MESEIIFMLLRALWLTLEDDHCVWEFGRKAKYGGNYSVQVKDDGMLDYDDESTE